MFWGDGLGFKIWGPGPLAQNLNKKLENWKLKLEDRKMGLTVAWGCSSNFCFVLFLILFCCLGPYLTATCLTTFKRSARLVDHMTNFPILSGAECCSQRRFL